MSDLDVDTIETKKPSAWAVVVGGLMWLFLIVLIGIGAVEFLAWMLVW